MARWASSQKTWNARSARILLNPLGKMWLRVSFGATLSIALRLSSFHVVETCSQWACNICNQVWKKALHLIQKTNQARHCIRGIASSQLTWPMCVLSPRFSMAFRTRFIKCGKSEIKFKNLCSSQRCFTLHFTFFPLPYTPRLRHIERFQAALSLQTVN